MKLKGLSIIIGFALLFSVSSCDLFDLDINTDPNNPATVSPALLLTNVEVDGIAGMVGSFNNTGMGFVVQSTASDNFFFNNQSWNGTWNFFYTGPLKDLDELIKIVEVDANGDGNADQPRYLGIAQVLKAYMFSTLVDWWGAIPYSEAFKGNAATQIKTPVYDDDAVIYENCIGLLNSAIANLALSSPAITGDVIYGGDATKWAKAARSLKLKLLLQTKNVPALSAEAAKCPSCGNLTEIQSLITNQAGLITAAADDFQFQFSPSISPDYRHPNYAMGGASYGGGYLAHQFMYELLRNNDPRLPFYVKRQTRTVLDPNDATQKQTIPCSQRADCVYGYFPLSNFVTQGIYGKSPNDLTTAEKEYLSGFFGRDRSDPSGVPDDAGIRTAHGLYPYGGLYDDAPEPANQNKGRGDGIFPIATSWMVKFWQIEAMLTLGVTHPTSSASQLLDAAITEQFAKVNTFVSKDAGAVAMASAAITSYKNVWVANFNSAASNNAKLAVALKQAWFCNYGNGLELYNTFRRTGLPSDLQLPLQLPGNFALRIPYAQDELNLNPNTPVIGYDRPEFAVFWDALKFQF
ncbi:MAG: SusD/RagB family nutrient-binding outer membrane lipoprotein [Cyclobacteriaceae bacterium]|nr:SusD/RagB family nutrient-binding outer membrane lipoprotein [Cyclobacteriaceae bacterium]